MTYRVVQWATGAMGTACLRMMLDHPDVEVVGVHVYSEAKAGRDIGEMAGRPATGVLSTSDPQAILDLAPDVVVHAGRIGTYGSHDTEIITLLEAGVNVISINGYSHPGHLEGPRASALRDACERGSSSLVAAGLNPGFAGEQLAVVASGLVGRLDHVEIVEHADSRAVRDPEYLFGVLGFGQTVAQLEARTDGPDVALDGMFTEVVAATAHHLGLALDRVEPDHVLHVTERDLEVKAGTVGAGTVSHFNWRWHGVTADVRRITLSIHWYLETTHLDSDDPPLWQLHLTGHPGVKVDVELEKHPEDTSRMPAEPYAVGASVVNTVPWVVAAEPGLHVRPVVTPSWG